MKSLIVTVLILLVSFINSCESAEEWSPGNADLLFTSNINGNQEIYLLPSGISSSKKWKRLTNHSSTDNWPCWSPFGNKIAFQSRRNGNFDIFVISADGSGIIQLTNNPDQDILPSWSPDGKKITFLSWRTDPKDSVRKPYLYIMNADGSELKRLIYESLNTSEGVNWSSDAKKIIYTQKIEDKPGAGIYIANSNGTNEICLTNDTLYNGSPAFSPDNSLIAFYSDNGISSSIEIMNIDGTGRKKIVSEGYNWYPHWSPDSKWIVYSSAMEESEFNDINIYAVKIEAKEKVIELITEPGRDLEGEWRPMDRYQ